MHRLLWQITNLRTSTEVLLKTICSLSKILEPLLTLVKAKIPSKVQSRQLCSLVTNLLSNSKPQPILLSIGRKQPLLKHQIISFLMEAKTSNGCLSRIPSTLHRKVPQSRWTEDSPTHSPQVIIFKARISSSRTINLIRPTIRLHSSSHRISPLALGLVWVTQMLLISLLSNRLALTSVSRTLRSISLRQPTFKQVEEVFSLKITWAIILTSQQQILVSNNHSRQIVSNRTSRINLDSRANSSHNSNFPMDSNRKIQIISSSRALVSSLKAFKHKILKDSKDLNLLVQIRASIIASSLNLVLHNSIPQISFSNPSSSLSNLARVRMLSNLPPLPQGFSLYKPKTRLCSSSPWRPPPNSPLISKYSHSKALCHRLRAFSSQASPATFSHCSSRCL